jgi:hypothetical protein
MTFDAHINDPERLVGFLAILLVSSYGMIRFYQRLIATPSRSDPWDEKVQLEIAEGNCAPVCHRCLTPHDSLVNFCPECGAPVGEYTNLLPFPYLFSIGHTLRIGTTGSFRRSPVTIAGFLFFGLVEYAVFAPIYWIFFFLNLSNQPRSTDSIEPTEIIPPQTGDQV